MQGKVCNDEAEEEPTAHTWDDEKMIAPFPSQSGTLCPIALEHGGAIYKNTLFSQRSRFSVLFSQVVNVFQQLEKFLIDYDVVIFAVGIVSNLPFLFRYLFGWIVVHGRNNNTLSAWHELCRVEAFFQITGKIAHIALTVLLYPTFISRLGNCIYGFGLCYATSSKAKFMSLIFYRGFHDK